MKFGICFSSRIGHFISDSLEEVLCDRSRPKNEICFWGVDKVSNNQWLKMLKNDLLISPLFKYLFFWNKLIPGTEKNLARMTINSTFPENSTRDVTGKFYFDLKKPSMAQKDIDICQKWLRSLGWEGQPYVCLLNRDESYLAKSSIHGENLLPRQSVYSYHSYRNSDINSYKLAVDFLLDKGFWVFRMGAITDTELKISHPNFYDYSFSSSKSDLLDIFLFSNCSACISSSTGIDILPQIYGIPTLILNGLPLNLCNTFYNTTWVPKRLYWAINHESLSLKDYIKNGFLTTKEYVDAGIKIVDLTPEEILEETRDFFNGLNHIEISTNDNKLLQEIFHKELRKWERYSQLHNFIHPNFRIGGNWLRSIINL